MKQCIKVPFGQICSIYMCAKWGPKLWILSEKSKNFDKKSEPNQSEPNQSKANQSKPNEIKPNQSKPNQSKWNFLKSPRAPWSYFFETHTKEKNNGMLVNLSWLSSQVRSQLGRNFSQVGS